MSGNEYFPILSNLFFLGCGRVPEIPSAGISGAESPVAGPMEEILGHGVPPDVTRALMGVTGGENRSSPLTRPSRLALDLGRRIDAGGEAARLFRSLPPGMLKKNEIALRRLRHLIFHASPDSTRGTYAGLLTRCLFEDIVRRKSNSDLRSLLHFLDSGARLQNYERFAASLLNPPGLVDPSCYRSVPEGLIALNLPGEALEALASVPENHGRRIEPPNHPTFRDALISALRVSAASPMAFLRIRRIGELLESGDRAFPSLLYSKIAELADRGARLVGGNVLGNDSRIGSQDSQGDAYFNDAPAARLLACLERFRTDADDKAIRRAEKRRGALAAVIRNAWSPGKMTPVDVSRAFRLLEDPISEKIAKAIEELRISLYVLEPEAFEKVGRRHSPLFDRNAAQEPAGVAERGAVIYVRLHPLGPKASLSADETLFDILASVVRRHRVAADSLKKPRETESDVVCLEFRALLEEIAWRSTHGDRRLLESCFAEGALGPALYLRDLLDPIR